MAQFNKVIILNKTFRVPKSDQSSDEYSRTSRANIVKISRDNTSSMTPSATTFLLIPSVTLRVLQTQQQLPLYRRTSIPEDILPRAVNLFLVNHYFKPEYKHLGKEELLKIADTIRIEVTMDDARFIEQITQDHKSWYWQKLRAGRVTSSKFKYVCEASLSHHPDINLLTEICYPEKIVCATSGSTNESDDRMAISQFIVQMKEIHTKFNCKKVGLIVDRNCPYFAASPDGFCSCECCGKYLIKIVCPFGSAENVSLKHLLEMKDSFMVVMNGAHCLRQDHPYYYQLQMQMALMGRNKFAYFYVWSTGFRITNKILVDLDGK